MDKNAYVAVLRAKRDVGNKDSHIGLLATSYNFIEKHNQLGGIDGRFRIDPKTYVAFQVLGTTSRRCFFEPAKGLHRPAATDPCFVNGNTRNYYRTGNGFAYSYELDYTGRNFGWRFNGNGRPRTIVPMSASRAARILTATTHSSDSATIPGRKRR